MARQAMPFLVGSVDQSFQPINVRRFHYIPIPEFFHRFIAQVDQFLPANLRIIGLRRYRDTGAACTAATTQNESGRYYAGPDPLHYRILSRYHDTPRLFFAALSYPVAPAGPAPWICQQRRLRQY